MFKLTFCLTFILFLCIPQAYAQNTGDPFKRSSELIKEGQKLHDEEKYEEALSKYNSVFLGDSVYYLALYERTISLIALKKYKEAVLLCNEGLATRSDYNLDFLIQKANAYDYLDQNDSSKALYDLGKKQYPLLHRFYFENGILLQKHDKWKEALEEYKNALKKNITHANSHLRIGLMAADANRPALALMALQMYCLLNKGNVVWTLTQMENIARGTYEIKKPVPSEVFSAADPFADIDLILLGKAVHSPKYKGIISLNYNLLKEWQVLHEKLPAQPIKDDWLYEYYRNFFYKTWQNKLFRGEALYVFNVVEDESIQKECKRYASESEAFITFAQKLIAEQREKRVLNLNGIEKTYTCRYHDNGCLQSAGNYDDKETRQGDWYFFYSNGQKEAEGSFDKEGMKNGSWKYFYVNGAASADKVFTAGTLTGVTNFYQDGTLETQEQYNTDGTIKDTLKVYHYSGAPRSLIAQTGKKDEIEKIVFNVKGVKTGKYKETNDLANGEYLEYHSNGKIYFKALMQDNYFIGEGQFFSSEGVLTTKANYLKGERSGEWIWYFDNGKLKEKGSYDAKGRMQGLWLTYHPNGQLMYEYTYKDDKIHGISKQYDDKGKLILESTNQNGITQSYIFYDEKQQIIHQDKIKKNKLYYVLYNDNRKKSAEGGEVNGEKQDKWLTYYPAIGKVSVEAYYDKGKKTREKHFFPNGVLEMEYLYTDGEINGFVKAFGKNGKVEAEGYYLNGLKNGKWKYYYPNGTIDTEEFYIDNEICGVDKEYCIEGKLIQEDYYTYKCLKKTILFDTLEKPYYSTLLPSGATNYILKSENGKPFVKASYKYGFNDGEYIRLYQNGNKKSVRNFKYGSENGKYESYYPNGKLYLTGWYKNGSTDSTWTQYNEDGKVMYTEKYKDNNKEGKATYYFANGNIRIESLHSDDVENGDEIRYAPDGTPVVKFLYEDGFIIGYSYLDADQKWLPNTLIGGNMAVVKTYFKNGSLAASFNIKNGTLDGEAVVNNANGKLGYKTTLEYGNYDGFYEMYNETGVPVFKKNFKYGEEEGKCVVYYPSGTPKRETWYRYGLKYGWETEFDAAGKITSKKYYVRDIMF